MLGVQALRFRPEKSHRQCKGLNRIHCNDFGSNGSHTDAEPYWGN